MKLFAIVTENGQQYEDFQDITFIVLAKDETEARATLLAAKEKGSELPLNGSDWDVHSCTEVARNVKFTKMPKTAAVLY